MTRRAIPLAVIAVLCVALATPASARSNIVGGSDARIESMPYQVAVLRKGQPNATDALVCGGTIIARYWIVTAATCVIGYRAADLEVVAGFSRLSSIRRVDGRAVDRIVRHPDFNLDTLVGNIALLRVVNPYPEWRALPLNRDREWPPVGTQLVASGWGYTDPNRTQRPDHLQAATLQDLAGVSGRCGAYNMRVLSLTQSMCVAGNSVLRAACYLDEGGPLTGITRRRLRVLVGVTSLTPLDPDACGSMATPGLFARVSTYAAWIDSHVPNAR